MKKLIVLFFSLILVLSFSITASAATQDFVDTLEDNYPLVYEKSEYMRYEKNIDTGETFYEKYSDVGAVNGTEYMVYKMDDDIVSFKIDCMHVNGLGDADTDVSVFVSENNRDWVEVKTKSTPQTFDDELYVNDEMAYWKMSTVYNRETLEPGYKFIKIQLNPYTVKDSCVWNTVLNTVTVSYGTVEESAPVSGSESYSSDAPQGADGDAAQNNSSISDTSSDIVSNSADSGASMGLIIALIAVVAVAAAAICAVIVLVFKNKKKN